MRMGADRPTLDELRAQAQGLRCDIEIQAMPLEDLYKVVVTRGSAAKEVRA